MYPRLIAANHAMSPMTSQIGHASHVGPCDGMEVIRAAQSISQRDHAPVPIVTCNP